MTKLSDLPNIGKEIERQLMEAGIETPDALREIGAENAWLSIQAHDSSACIHRLLALEGAIEGVRKTLILQERKVELKAFYLAHRL